MYGCVFKLNLFTQDNRLTQDKFQCCHLPLPLIKDYLDILYIIILLFIQFSSKICVLYLNEEVDDNTEICPE
jgi:hypothetical protein